MCPKVTIARQICHLHMVEKLSVEALEWAQRDFKRAYTMSLTNVPVVPFLSVKYMYSALFCRHGK